MSLDISGQVGCQQGAALSVHSLVYTDSHTLPPSLTRLSHNLLSGCGGRRVRGYRETVTVTCVPLLLMPVLTTC